MREITPHPEQQRTYAELRSEFRTENQNRIHSQLMSHPVGWGVLGDSSLAWDRYSHQSIGQEPSEWASEMLSRLDAPVVQDFGLGDVPFTASLAIEKLAQAALLHDSVTWEDGPGVTDSDAPACDLQGMTEDELCDYVERSIQESAQ